MRWNRNANFTINKKRVVNDIQENPHKCYKKDSNFSDFPHLPGDSKNIEKTIIDKTAEITSNAMHIPRQFLFSVDDIASSYKEEIKKKKKNRKIKKSINMDVEKKVVKFLP